MESSSCAYRVVFLMSFFLTLTLVHPCSAKNPREAFEDLKCKVTHCQNQIQSLTTYDSTALQHEKIRMTNLYNEICILNNTLTCISVRWGLKKDIPHLLELLFTYLQELEETISVGRALYSTNHELNNMQQQRFPSMLVILEPSKDTLLQVNLMNTDTTLWHSFPFPVDSFAFIAPNEPGQLALLVSFTDELDKKDKAKTQLPSTFQTYHKLLNSNHLRTQDQLPVMKENINQNVQNVVNQQSKTFIKIEFAKQLAHLKKSHRLLMAEMIKI